MFISLEGTEGVGKTTLIQRLARYFQDKGCTVILTREPGGTPLAEDIRQLLLTTRDEAVVSDTELLLMYAARCQHIQQVILPALQAEHIVISDRFVDASFAYQCAGRGLSHEKLMMLNQTFIPIMPHLTLWLDAPVELGMNRAKERGKLDRFEQEKLEFFIKVQKGYQYLHQQEPQRIKRIDATQSADAVFLEAIQYL